MFLLYESSLLFLKECEEFLYVDMVLLDLLFCSSLLLYLLFQSYPCAFKLSWGGKSALSSASFLLDESKTEFSSILVDYIPFNIFLLVSFGFTTPIPMSKCSQLVS